VPEHGGAHRRDVGGAGATAGEAAVDRARHRLQQAIGVQLDPAVRGGAGLVGHVALRARDRAAARIEDARAGGAGADVERQDEHVR
jgi:hypothetical protein